jgi:hypothetical protein
MNHHRRITNRALVAVIVGNLFAIPIYWLEASYVTQQFIMRPLLQDLVPAFVAAAAAFGIIWGWYSRVALGVILQISLLLPFVVGGLLARPGDAPDLTWSDFTSARFTLAVIAVCVIPGALLALVFIVVQRNQHERRTGGS